MTAKSWWGVVSFDGETSRYHEVQAPCERAAYRVLAGRLGLRYLHVEFKNPCAAEWAVDCLVARDGRAADRWGVVVQNVVEGRSPHGGVSLLRGCPIDATMVTGRPPARQARYRGFWGEPSTDATTLMERPTSLLVGFAAWGVASGGDNGK